MVNLQNSALGLGKIMFLKINYQFIILPQSPHSFFLTPYMFPCISFPCTPPTNFTLENSQKDIFFGGYWLRLTSISNYRSDDCFIFYLSFFGKEQELQQFGDCKVGSLPTFFPRYLLQLSFCCLFCFLIA